MKSKAPLLLMEQMVMLLVFALAAALCLQAFVKSDGLSGDSEDRDRAVALCQSAAEAVRHCGGDLPEAAALLEVPYPYDGEGSPLEIHYNADWTLCDSREYAFCLRAVLMDSGVAGLGRASVEMADARSQTVIFEVQTAWQEPLVLEVEIDDGTAE